VVNMSKITSLKFLIPVLVTLVFPVYYLSLQIQENQLIDKYLSKNDLADLPLTKETAVRVSDQVRRDFNIQTNTFKSLDVFNKPFLREDTHFLLSHKEGECGEGTRVIVNLLSRLGFDATRLTLYNKKLKPAHTLISVAIEDKEFLLDSINSSVKTNTLLKDYDVSLNDFAFIHRIDNIAKRRSNLVNNKRPEALAGFFDYYLLYSYEATPYSKVLAKIGLDMQVFNFKRPSRWMSVLAEKPRAIMFIVSLFTSFFIALVVFRFCSLVNIGDTIISMLSKAGR